ncbi:hypothetical protein IQ277_04700 [Nostocales cyanobacterium LEGE 12452]|nr:hypothetical protein [Nostocales cyanobacterium LEGE 12452]
MEDVRGRDSHKSPMLCKIWRVLFCKDKDQGGDPCVVIPGSMIRRPDPCIYSQFLLMQLGKPVTWDNPDVRIFLNGVEQYTYNLTADTEYEVQITVHNASRDKPANGTAVQVEWIEFGAGAKVRHPIANLVANVPVWPGTAVVSTQWRTPATPGHYCIEVDLDHPDDGNPANNRGWNNTQVYAANSPVDRQLRIFNAYPGDCPLVAEGGGPYLDYRRAIFGWGVLAAMAAMFYSHVLRSRVLDTDNVFIGYALLMLIAYVVAASLGLAYYRLHNNRLKPPQGKRPTNPNRINCHLVEIDVDSHVFEDQIGKNFDPETVFAETPLIWPAHVEPSSFVFQAGEAFRDVTFHTDAPDEPGPPGVFNVRVRQGGEPIGGATFVITRGD